MAVVAEWVLDKNHWMMIKQLDSAWFDATVVVAAAVVVEEDVVVAVAALNYLNLNEHDASD